MMKAKYIIIIFGIAFLSGLIGIIFFGPSTVCTNYILEEADKITDSEKKPRGTWSDLKSPNDDSELEEITIDPYDPEIDDEPWRLAAYSNNENIFWIADMPGFILSWYGPFEGDPCLE